MWNKQTSKQVQQIRRDEFERTILPHLSSAYNFARWLTRDQHDAEDVVQEAILRALRSFDTFVPGRDARAWLLAIVRNTCSTWLRKHRPQEHIAPLDEASLPSADLSSDPEAVLVRELNSGLVHAALDDLPVEYREILILRELEELCYKDLSRILGIPLGTVMSRLSRARNALFVRLSQGTGERKG